LTTLAELGEHTIASGINETSVMLLDDDRVDYLAM
jgi:hypothetical protein